MWGKCLSLPHCDRVVYFILSAASVIESKRYRYFFLSQIEYCEDKEKVIEDEQDSDGGWVDTHHYDNAGSPTIEEKVEYYFLYLHTIAMFGGAVC